MMFAYQSKQKRPRKYKRKIERDLSCKNNYIIYKGLFDMVKYTKINDEMVAKYGLKVAWIYAKLHYRMNLSKKHHKYYSKSHHSHYIIYKVNDLARDCHMSRNSVIRALKKLEKSGYIAKFRTIFCNHIYLPKFNSGNQQSTKTNTYESSKVKLPRKQRNQNKNLKSKSVYCSSVKRSKSEKYPKVTEIIKKYGNGLFRYAINILHNDTAFQVHNPYHFVVGILRRWKRKGIKTVNDAMLSEHDSRAKLPAGPKIPIFKL